MIGGPTNTVKIAATASIIRKSISERPPACPVLRASAVAVTATMR